MNLPQLVSLALAAGAVCNVPSAAHASSGDSALVRSATSLSPDTASSRAGTSYARVHQAIRDAKLDGSAVTRVRELRLSAGGGELVLSTGVLVLLEPVDGRAVGAVFVGQGRFTLQPPHPVEREQLRRFLGAREARLDFESAVLFFTDAVAAAVLSRAEFGPGAVPGVAAEALADALAFLESEDGDLDAGLMAALLAAEPWGYLHAHLVPPRGRAFFFRVDERQPEPVSFGRQVRRGDRYDLLSQYAIEDAAPPPGLEEDGDLVEVRHVEVDAAISDRLDFSARATLELRSRVAGGSWVPFWLHSALHVDSARWGDGTLADFFRLEEGTRVWVRLPEEPAEDGRRLSLWYGGDDLLKRQGVWIQLASATDWYPRHARGYGSGSSTFDLTFRSPRDMAFTSVGEEVFREETDDHIVTRWVTTFPSPHASFNIGWMEEYELTDPRIPPVKLQVAERAFRRMQIDAERAGDRRARTRIRDMQELVGADLMNSISFFQTWFGPPPISGLHATTIPYGHGQAFPGLIHLSWATFEGIERMTRGRDLGRDEAFRAHEVAHQWWGLGVRPRSYRDSWLSEGIAEFAGLWYMQTVRGSPETYMRQLERYRKDIIDRREDAGPIWLGPRLHTSETPEDYGLMVYSKGAWVMHMLRNLFLDLDTMEEERFIVMLRELYREYEGRRLSTEEFRAHVERHLGIDMGWFFDQWVYGTEIPSYEVSYTGRELEDGRYGVALRVEQEDVSPDFQMIVPLLLDFRGDGWARVRVRVAGPVTELELPPLPRRPDRIVFGDLDSVLAEVKDRGWRR